MLLPISKEFERVQAAKYQLGAVRFFSHACKDDREWQVLGALQRLLVIAGDDAPEYAIKQDPPDFMTFAADRRAWGAVEVVEVLRPGYERHKFHKKYAWSDEVIHIDPEDTLIEPWVPLREQIAKKALKPYPMAVTLLVYHDIGRLSFKDWITPFHMQILDEHGREPFANLDSFERVFVISSDLACLVELFPSARTIIPDLNPSL